MLLNRLRADVPLRQVLVGAFWTAAALNADRARGLAELLRPSSALEASKRCD